ncbi:MAG: heme utilization cystosolic carrier protein HutX [Burkholderiaceae bacterium]|jgi:putative heme utilization carrier protein HutX|nr:heme utilization cystosolic carrier protein HutX [Burkholderiaceae bacterium]
MAQTPHQQDMSALKERLASNSAVMLEGLPEAEKLTMAQMIECLPRDMWTHLDGKHFIDVLEDVATWGKVTLIMHTSDVILEFSGDFPAGKLGHGYYNLGGASGLHGHLRADHCGHIYLVERPFMGKPTVSLQFMNTTGDTMFKVYLGRDENGEIYSHQIAAMREFAKKYSNGVA